MFRHYATVVFSAALFLVFSLFFAAVGLAQERDPISMEVGETREFFGARVCSGFESSYSVDDNLPAFIDLETISVIQSTSSITGVTTARIRFSLTVALDALTGTYPVDISYTLNRPGGECTRDFAYDLTITLAQPPVAEFVAERTLVAEGANVAFTDLSEHAIGSWSWDFGDGGSSNERNPEYSYTSEGVYTVTLVVTGPAGNDTEVKSDYITVRPEGAPGVLRWQFDTGGSIFSSPAVADDGTIYVVSSGDESIHALRPDGSRKWWLSTINRAFASPMVGDDGTVFVGSNFGLEAINPDGTRAWSTSLPHRVDGLALGQDGTVYVSGFDLFAFTPTGDELWQLELDPTNVEGFDGLPVVDLDGRIYVTDTDGRLLAVDPNGNTIWVFEPRFYVNQTDSGPALGRDGTIFYGTDFFLYAVQPTGMEGWENTLSRDYYSPVIGPDDSLFMVVTDGAGCYECRDLHKVDPRNGSLLWSFESSGQSGFSNGAAPALGADGTLYYGSSDGTFYAVKGDGTEKWQFATGDGIFSSPAIGGDGSIYVTSVDGNLYAIGASNSDYADGPWPRGEGRDNRNTARATNQHPRGIIDTPAGNVVIEAGQTVSFSATVLDENSVSASILWDFDGGASNSDVEDPGTVSFATVGTYTVSLQVTDDFGLVDPDPPAVTVTVTAPNQPPDGTITSPAGNTTITVGESLSFAGSASDENPGTVDYLWDFDGVRSNSTARNPGSVTFNSVGSFTISLTVTDEDGLPDSTPASVTITVEAENQPPNGTITSPAGNTTITVGSSVSFAGSASDENPGTVDYLWDFDGVRPDSTARNPGSVTFDSVGSYTITLTVTDEDSLSDQTPATVIITVDPPSPSLIHADGFE